MAYDHSNGHVNDDVMCPRKVKVINQSIWGLLPRDTDLVAMEHL